MKYADAAIVTSNDTKFRHAQEIIILAHNTNHFTIQSLAHDIPTQDSTTNKMNE